MNVSNRSNSERRRAGFKNLNRINTKNQASGREHAKREGIVQMTVFATLLGEEVAPDYL
jgi:hypothetical protein